MKEEEGRGRTNGAFLLSDEKGARATTRRGGGGLTSCVTSSNDNHIEGNVGLGLGNEG